MWRGFSSTLSDYAIARHTRLEAGIQCHGWWALIHPWILDSGTNLSGTDLHNPKGVRQDSLM